MNQILRHKDKGNAGLTILLSLIVMLFVIGLIIMIFALMGNALSTASYTSTSGSVVNETLTSVTGSGKDYAYSTLRSVVCSTSNVINASGFVIGATNYTLTNCNIRTTGTNFNNTNWKVTYTYVYSDDNIGTDAINDTVSATVGVTTYFPLFITIGAMVVLILLTVIIITAIRSSGLVGGVQSGQQNVGTA